MARMPPSNMPPTSPSAPWARFRARPMWGMSAPRNTPIMISADRVLSRSGTSRTAMSTMVPTRETVPLTKLRKLEVVASLSSTVSLVTRVTSSPDVKFWICSSFARKKRLISEILASSTMPSATRPRMAAWVKPATMARARSPSRMAMGPPRDCPLPRVSSTHLVAMGMASSMLVPTRPKNTPTSRIGRCGLAKDQMSS